MFIPKQRVFGGVSSDSLIADSGNADDVSAFINCSRRARKYRRRINGSAAISLGFFP